MFAFIRLRVADYETWKTGFDEHVEARIRNGCVGHRVFRDEDDANALTLMLEFTSRGGATSLLEDDVTLLSAIRDEGVEGGPHNLKWQIDYVDQADAADYTTWPYA